MSEVIYGALFGAGYLAGIIRAGMKFRRRYPEQPEPICGCDHHLAQHNPKTGLCMATSKVADQWRKADSQGNPPIPTHYAYVQCSCQQYVGPKPIDSFFVSDYMIGESEDNA